MPGAGVMTRLQRLTSEQKTDAAIAAMFGDLPDDEDDASVEGSEPGTERASGTAEGTRVEETEILVDPFKRHGSTCRCRRRTTLAEIPMAHSYRVAISRLLGRHPASVPVQDLINPQGSTLPAVLRHAIHRSTATWAAYGCPYDGGNSPPTPWRSRPIPTDRFSGWPDDWDAIDWTWWLALRHETSGQADSLPPLKSISGNADESVLLNILERHWWVGFGGDSDD